MIELRLALFEVADPTGATDLARQLTEAGYTVVANRTAAHEFAQAGVPFVLAEQLTGVPDILDGRVQTLHPAVHGGIVARRSHPDHMAALQQFNVAPIDIVVVNLWPFSAMIDTLGAAGVAPDDMLCHAEIAGAALIRAAAGNYPDVLTLVDPDDYEPALEELVAGRLDVDRRKHLAAKAFRYLGHFDDAIAAWLAGAQAPDPASAPAAPFGQAAHPRHRFGEEETVTLDLGAAEPLEGGENPQQSAWFHRDRRAFLVYTPDIVADQIRQLPYAALLDADLAWAAARDLPVDLAGAVVVKHGNPTGAAALTTSVAGALLRAMDADPFAVSGAVLAVNRLFDLAAARALGDRPVSIVVAPEFEEEAWELLAQKPWIRPIALGALGDDPIKRLVHVTHLGVLIQQPDTVPLAIETALVATRMAPSPSEWRALDVAWRLCKHAKSNAVVIADENGSVGVGAGQVSRQDAATIAGGKCRKGYRPVAAASDGQLTGPEVLDTLLRFGVKALVQPGGSPRDAEIAAAADARGMTMVLTGVSHYRH
ncbi:MAG: bifunctional phosphoribosylaminoimidazolecarboxamide formyltransferase/IMP cyclohydrolase [Deltaproteobacteria bacterium]|nr:bifunctional phosphoribosylaminoimidazolecarboxamide formyltransferase/IMP cyclohydrolase [Deltaproteobacteria bacterium]